MHRVIASTPLFCTVNLCKKGGNKRQANAAADLRGSKRKILMKKKSKS